MSGTLNLVPRPTAGGAMAITVFPYKYVANKHGNKECYKHISTNLQKKAAQNNTLAAVVGAR